ncbi:MAG: hypothetical protein ABIP03_11680 [Aquihabitans sp.]
MPHFRHTISKAVVEAAKAPSDEWDRIDGPPASKSTPAAGAKADNSNPETKEA